MCIRDRRSVGKGVSGAAPSQGLTPRAKSVVELAVSEAARMGSSAIGTAHLLMGILREGGNMGLRILRTVGVDPNKMYSAVVKRVDNTNNNPKVIVSRTDERFLRRLFEQEVPEVHDGLITIKAVARKPGERAKIAVESYDDRIDPVGACVGIKGSRIHGIVRELRNENIDVISYTANPQLYIQRALSPAKISTIRLDEEEKKAEVFLRPEEVSLAIGKGGLNIKLATMLTGYAIDVYRDIEPGEEDIYLDEFRDEIDDWVIESLKNLGLGTAKSVLNAPKDQLDLADLEDSTLEHVMQVLRAEFED